MVNKSVWMDKDGRNSEYLWQFPYKDSLHLQVSNVQCTWLSLGRLDVDWKSLIFSDTTTGLTYKF
jgi:hypothetical protein